MLLRAWPPGAGSRPSPPSLAPSAAHSPRPIPIRPRGLLLPAARGSPQGEAHGRGKRGRGRLPALPALDDPSRDDAPDAVSSHRRRQTRAGRGPVNTSRPSQRLIQEHATTWLLICPLFVRRPTACRNGLRDAQQLLLAVPTRTHTRDASCCGQRTTTCLDPSPILPVSPPPRSSPPSAMRATARPSETVGAMNRNHPLLCSTHLAARPTCTAI